MPAAATLVWLRHDLRLADNPALAAARARGAPVLPVFVWAPQEEGDWAPGGASRWWLHHSLAALDGELRARGSRLVIRRGASGEELARLVRETGAGAVLWNRRYEPAARARDEAVAAGLSARGVAVGAHGAALLHEPARLVNREGRPYQVFTPFWKACLARGAPPPPLPAPRDLPPPARWPRSLDLRELGLEPAVDWAAGLRAAWTPGERGASVRLRRLLAEALPGYPTDRDRPDREGVSRLSPHLRWGEIGPRQIWHATARAVHRAGQPAWARGAEAFLRQLGWREFAYHLLWHFPDTPARPLRAPFERFPWREDAAARCAWRRGLTGYPFVDAGLRQLWATGWLHNRARMVVGSFLVKDLLLPWPDGARWFWDTLVDADLANNTLGWQWAAGCGADAAPYFRVFNPVLQGRKFDPDGAYVRRWVPELARLPDRWLHQPWAAPGGVLAAAGVALGAGYPRPVVEHEAARARALAALASLRSG